MTVSLLAEFSHSVQIKRTDIVCPDRAASSGHLGALAFRDREGLPAGLAQLPGPVGFREGKTLLKVSAPGVIGSAIVRAARKSAGIGRWKLARIIKASPRAVRSWENGTCPLFLVAYDDLGRLAAAFGQAGAKVGCDVAELMLASRCDLLIAGMLQGFEDYAEVPPIEEDSIQGEAARDLLRWALAGVVPQRYRAMVPARPLLTRHDLNAFTELALQLGRGSQGDQLASYGRALTTTIHDR